MSDQKSIQEQEKEIETERRAILLKQVLLEKEVKEYEICDDSVKDYRRKKAMIVMINDELEANDQKLMKLI